MSVYWVLNGTQTVEATFDEWIQQGSVRIARDEQDGVVISTMFVGLRVTDVDPPFLFETMVFGGTADGRRNVYRTWTEASVGHGRMVREIFGR
jgi:hypothetical protein